MLEIKDLHATINGKEILKGINLTVKSGEVHAIMGPNGSGKSTLSNVLVGHPAYEVTKGSVTFDGKDLLAMSAEDRSHEGLFLSSTNTNTVLTKVAMTIGQNSAAIMSKYNISATPEGTKKKPRLATKKSDNPCTQCSFIQPNCKNNVSKSMPIILDGSLIPVR